MTSTATNEQATANRVAVLQARGQTVVGVTAWILVAVIQPVQGVWVRRATLAARAAKPRSPGLAGQVLDGSTSVASPTRSAGAPTSGPTQKYSMCRSASGLW